MRTCSNKPVLIFERKELILKCAMYLLLISIERGDLTKVLYIFLNGRNPKPSGYNVVDALLNVRDLFYDSTLDNTRREFALIEKYHW